MKVSYFYQFPTSILFYRTDPIRAPADPCYQHQTKANRYRDTASLALEAAKASEDRLTRLKTWGRENRYGIITASWVASMAIALGLVGRNPYLSRSQKLVQARVYAQALTVGVFVATAALEIGDANRGQGRWETVKIIDPNDPEHKHVIEKQIHHERYAGEDLWRGEWVWGFC